MKYDRVQLSKPIPVKLPPDLLKRIDAISKQIGEARSTVMRFAMSIGLAALEKAITESPENLLALFGRYPPPPGERVLLAADAIEKEEIAKIKASSGKRGPAPSQSPAGPPAPAADESTPVTQPPTVPRESRYPRPKRKKSDHA